MKLPSSVRQRVRELRAQGRSYAEIVQEIPISQSTVSLWCRDIKLSTAHRRRLQQLMDEGASRARARWAAIRRERKHLLLKEIAVATKKEIGELSRRERFIAGLMLYAGEGDRSRERVGMSNTDPRILHFMLGWFKEFCDLDREKFKAHLYLHTGRNLKKAIRYWSDVLEISPRQFVYVYRAPLKKSHKGNVHKHGVCSIRHHNVLVHRKLVGWINAVLNFSHNKSIPG